MTDRKVQIRNPVPLPQLPRGFDARASAHDQYHDLLSRALYDWAREYAQVITSIINIYPPDPEV